MFVLAPPTVGNLDAFERWANSPKQSEVYLGESLEGLVRVEVNQGDTVLIPAVRCMTIKASRITLSHRPPTVRLPTLTLPSGSESVMRQACRAEGEVQKGSSADHCALLSVCMRASFVLHVRAGRTPWRRPWTRWRLGGISCTPSLLTPRWCGLSPTRRAHLCACGVLTTRHFGRPPQRIHQMEDRLRVPASARFPSYQELMWRESPPRCLSFLLSLPSSLQVHFRVSS